MAFTITKTNGILGYNGDPNNLKNNPLDRRFLLDLYADRGGKNQLLTDLKELFPDMEFDFDNLDSEYDFSQYNALQDQMQKIHDDLTKTFQQTDQSNSNQFTSNNLTNQSSNEINKDLFADPLNYKLGLDKKTPQLGSPISNYNSNYNANTFKDAINTTPKKYYDDYINAYGDEETIGDEMYDGTLSNPPTMNTINDIKANIVSNEISSGKINVPEKINTNANVDLVTGDSSSKFNANGKVGQSIDKIGSQINNFVQAINPTVDTKQSQIANYALDNISKIGAMIPGSVGAAVAGAAQATKLIGNSVTTNVKQFRVNQGLASRQEASYGNAFDTMRSQKGGKYNLFSFGEAKKQKNLYNKSRQLSSKIGSIDNQNLDYIDLANTPNYRTSREVQLLGGLNNQYLSAKQGAKLEKLKEISKQVQAYKQGKEIKKTRNLKELIEYAKKENPRFIQRLSESPRGIEFIDDEGNKTRGNVYLEWETDKHGNAIIYPRIQEMEDGSLKFLSSQEAVDRAIENNNILIMSPTEAKLFFSKVDPPYNTAYKLGWPEMFNQNWDNDDSIIENIPKHKQGGSFNIVPSGIFLVSEIEEFKEGGIIETQPSFIELMTEVEEFKEGGQFNVIPEGALHARLHHMENDENITKKGIPVVDNQGEQQAEIEREEIIFRISVTQTLEELMKKYYSDEYTQKEKDEFAIEAGKLLTTEILYNTQDNTGLLQTIN